MIMINLITKVIKNDYEMIILRLKKPNYIFSKNIQNSINKCFMQIQKLRNTL
jgi:hypothetical protein